MARPPFSFVGALPDHDALKVLEQLRRQAHSGDLLGLVAIPIYKQRKYALLTTGEAERNPGFAALTTGIAYHALLTQVAQEADQG